MKMLIAAATVVALTGISSSSSTPGVSLGAVSTPDAPHTLAAAPVPKPSAKAAATKPAEPVRTKPTPQRARATPVSPETVGAAQMWLARGAGAVDTLKQVVEEMAKSVQKGDLPNVRNDCRLVGLIGDAIIQSLPAPDKQVDSQFRQAADRIKAGAANCTAWGPGTRKAQTDAFLNDMKAAVDHIKSTKALLQK